MAQNLKVVITYHPAIERVEESYSQLSRMDTKKAVDLVFKPDKPIDYHEVHIARDSSILLRFLEQYPLTKFPKMTYDIETHYGFITCAAVSFDGFRGISIPLYGSKLDMTDRARMMYLLSMELSTRELINQNIGYDKRISQRFGLYLPNVVWDTMLAANTIAPEFPKRLDFLTSIYTDMSFYKDEGREFDPKNDSIDQLYGYNCKDAITTYQIYEKQVEDLKELEMLEFFTAFIMKLFNVYYALDSVGIKIDIKKRDELVGKYESLFNIKKMELDAITSLTQPLSLNINSPSQIGKYMEANHFPVLYHRLENGHQVPNTDVDSMEKMRISDPSSYKKCKISHQYAIRFINLILLLRRIDQVFEYVNVGIHPWGRVHTNSNLAGTRSGRTSGNQTSDGLPLWTLDKKGRDVIEFKQLGQSFQTVTKHGFIIEGEEDIDIESGSIGKDIREMYIPDPHMLLIEIDGAQAEARVCEVLAEDYTSLEKYNTIDIHCLVASMIFTEYTYDQIFDLSKRKKTDEGLFMRNIGKHSKHAKSNGMDHYEFAVRYLHMANFRDSLNKAKVILQKIDKAYPNIENVFHREVEVALRTTRTLISPCPYGMPCGRKRLFYKKIDKHYLNVAFAYIPQSTVSDNTKNAMLRSTDRLDRTRAWFVAENHDSINALVHYSYARQYIKIMKEELERPIDFRGCSLSRDYELIIPAEVAISRTNWKEMKDLKKLRI